jgi:glycerol-3-phosphate acyltransferase PlsY
MIATLFIILAYLFGSVNFAIILCKLAKVGDPRTEGSNNPGATNVLRLGGKKLALFVIIGDALKGVVPVILARLCNVDGIALSVVALAAVLGHMFPLFFRFQGGKGIATTLGAILALSWVAGIAVLVSWGVIALLFRFSSLASLVSIILLPVYIYLFSSLYYFWPMLVLAIIVIYRHRANIKRLCTGKEPKIGKKKTS